MLRGQVDEEVLLLLVACLVWLHVHTHTHTHLPQVLRQLRHPNILKYVSSVSEPGESFLWAESVVPLSALLAHLSAVEAVAGIRDIARGIEFMHEKVSKCSQVTVM